jgi:hypothetical protein
MQERRDAFVVWLDPLEEPSAPTCHGQVEHVPSSTRVRFSTADELIQFLATHRHAEGEPTDR